MDGRAVELWTPPYFARDVRKPAAKMFSHTSKLNLPGDQGLQKLIEGNQRFERGQAQFHSVCKETLADLAKGQHPFATILGCSDSRVPPELIFDANFGELFIVRVAGNVISPEVMGSLQYAENHLRTPLFVVLGHEGCGAVKAALESKLGGIEHRSRIQTLVDNILPGLPDVSSQASEEEQLTTAVEANVRWSIHQISETAEGQNAMKAGIRLMGAIYEIASGHVRFLP
jgi:carbonic anhydrase